eukprot:gnl/TRDRNA2_/TRDRNA2_154144_c2_seq1.p2 gnl/TRDRNA2_/TRDRNA2_154144_c2~~gnl/TRDRNA2_/TRDRNA2_154144_c2_seq1.p2  ORF type:complete len:111 (+),score=14.39 gnl/TRDRNA2_/TRDRNA2_154144_c2_seq1:3-335(+)
MVSAQRSLELPAGLAATTASTTPSLATGSPDLPAGLAAAADAGDVQPLPGADFWRLPLLPCSPAPSDDGQPGQEIQASPIETETAMRSCPPMTGVDFWRVPLPDLPLEEL